MFFNTTFVFLSTAKDLPQRSFADAQEDEKGLDTIAIGLTEPKYLEINIFVSTGKRYAQEDNRS